jgi:hypothetical protein
MSVDIGPPGDSAGNRNASFTKKGPGRYRPPSPFSKSRQLVLDRIKENPINRLTGRELVKLEQLVKAARRAKKGLFDIHAMAETIISQRRVIVAGE